jgi:cell division transport system permease protein
MIGGALIAPRLDLPFGRDATGRFLPWIIALMVYLAVLGGVGLMLLGDTLGEWDRSLSTTLTVQLPADTSAGRIETTVAALKQTKGVAEIHLLGADETARLIAPWLGPGVSADTLPLPHLIDLHLAPAAQVDLADLKQKLTEIDPGAELADHRSSLIELRGFAMKVEGIIGAGVAIVAVLLVLTVVFSARTGLAIHQPVVELLHLLGAPDRYIARQFQTHALWLGLRGGVIGGIAAAVTIVILGRAAGAISLPLPVAAPGLLDWRPWALLILATIAAGVVAMVTARATIARRLARMP